MNSFLSLLRYSPYFNLLDMLFIRMGNLLMLYEQTTYICTVFKIIDITQMDNIDSIRKLVIVLLNLHTTKITPEQNPR